MNVMKEKYISFATMALIVTGAYFAKSMTTQNDGFSSLELANAEALANLEDSEKIPCYADYFYDPYEKFIYCFNCEERTGHAIEPVHFCP